MWLSCRGLKVKGILKIIKDPVFPKKHWKESRGILASLAMLKLFTLIEVLSLMSSLKNNSLNKIKLSLRV